MVLAVLLLSMAGLIESVLLRAGPNLVENPSFEVDKDRDGWPDGWSIPKDLCRWEPTIARTGQHSLRFENRDPKVYRLVTQALPLRPGRQYVAWVWVKAENVKGGNEWDNRGAGICVEWVDEKGRWLGGIYPCCLEGTYDWTPTEPVVFAVPKEAAKAGVVLYIRRGGTGVAWFDDVEVREFRGPLLKAFLLKPSYRGIVRAGSSAAVEVEAVVRPEQWDIEPKGLSLSVRFKGKEMSRERIEKGQTRLAFRTPPLGLGRFPVDVLLIGPEGRVLAQERLGLEAKPEDWFGRAVYIDQRGRLMVEGKPFFPIGIYLGPTEEEHLKRLRDAGFNTILCYGYGVGPDPVGYMDRAHKLGLKVIYSVKDFYEGTRYFPKWLGKKGTELAKEYVTLLRAHPALLAWYINDELGLQWLPKLREMYELVKSLDPDRPTYHALCRPEEFGHYFSVLDAIGPDPYPIPRHPVTMVADWVDKAVEGMRGVKPVWAILQVFGWRAYSGREEDRDPTYEEERCMTYLALIHGAKGVLYYSYFDLFVIDRRKDIKAPPELFQRRFENVRKLARELNLLSPIVLQGREVKLEFRPPEGLHLKALAVEGDLFLLVANSSERELQFEVPLPGRAKGEPVDLEGRRRGKIRKGRVLSDSLGPLECATYRLPGVF